MPMYTLTLRKSSPDRLELRYAETTTQTTLKQTDLAPLKGTWLEVTETITYGTSGAYSIEIKKVIDNSLLFEYANNDIINWRAGADFVRPKWGIYRSLNASQDLRDEEVLFANFSIEELNPLSVDDNQISLNTIEIFPNPSTDIVTIIQTKQNRYNSFIIYNILGQQITNQTLTKNEFDISFLAKGIYTIVFKNKENKVVVKKLIKK